MSYYKQFVEALLNVDTFYILDTETTGLHFGEICQIAIIDNIGQVHLDSLIKTYNRIPEDATNIHGITDAMVADSPTWPEIQPQVVQLLHSQVVVIYNAVYDRKMLHQSAERWNMPHYGYKEHSTFLCAMEAYAEYYGQWNEYHQSYRWQSLSHAARSEGITVDRAHSALGDCQMTLGVIAKMLASELEG